MGLKNVQGWLLWNASPTLFSQKKFSFVKGKEMKKSLLPTIYYLKKILLCAFKALSEPVKEARINVEQIFLFNVLLGP